MTYCLEGDKYSTYGPTTSGMKLLRETVMSRSLQFPTLTDFVLEGSTINPSELAEESNKLAQEVDDENLKSTLQHLSKVAAENKKELRLC